MNLVQDSGILPACILAHIVRANPELTKEQISDGEAVAKVLAEDPEYLVTCTSTEVRDYLVWRMLVSEHPSA